MLVAVSKGIWAVKQQNPSVLNWTCQLTQADLCRGRKTVVWFILVCQRTRHIIVLYEVMIDVHIGSCDDVSASHQWRENLSSLTDAVRWSYGAGLVLRLGGVARLELNYVVPMKLQSSDRS